MTVIFTRAAQGDLAHIRKHIGKDNPHAASRMAVELIAACERLELFPERGAQVPSPRRANSPPFGLM